MRGLVISRVECVEIASTCFFYSCKSRSVTLFIACGTGVLDVGDY